MLALIGKAQSKPETDESSITWTKDNFTDLEIEQTKEMIRRTLLLAQDSQSSLIERVYLKSLLEIYIRFWQLDWKIKSRIGKAICKAANDQSVTSEYSIGE